MINFFKKFYSVFLRQNWWLEDIFAPPSRPMFLGTMYLGASIVAILLKWQLAFFMVNSAIVLCLLLMTITGILWLRIGKAPWYIVGFFGTKHEKLFTVIWIIFWGGLGISAILALLWEYGR
jgi:hypothetical protein